MFRGVERESGSHHVTQLRQIVCHDRIWGTGCGLQIVAGVEDRCIMLVRAPSNRARHGSQVMSVFTDRGYITMVHLERVICATLPLHTVLSGSTWLTVHDACVRHSCSNWYGRRKMNLVPERYC